MPKVTAKDLVKLLDQKTIGKLNAAGWSLALQASDLVRPLIDAFPLMQGHLGRKGVLWLLMRVVPAPDEVIDLAKAACFDKSYLVRSDAVELLGRTLSDDVLPTLESLANDPDPRIAFSARSHIFAVKQKDPDAVSDYWDAHSKEASEVFGKNAKGSKRRR